ncbi:glycosyltransferase family 1 protein [Corynebacterium pseudodiphtheriticum]|uniref:glycosyltransferase family 4 protein n=1 Tax=Corynebacterium pseudodiphtheriticum TaxID=37637 RepID=UPI002543E30A|nr:glycosyltransferase family 1 protein [Corynebacterium pseudodiphtheriticum]MDK4206434.1 glycosyltransferase family 1 protein [Corynebacterium pseudodiphtheriticum]MDK4242276.1 glycosyltransferase family 1 protein [Corynebacterium pseudodiphtheriticum]MDK4278178.1 glycosyltransferase family 1 protein [Corynebacterium pseudodiphtheriticum]MDK4327619.1 glycosyltransferase family 1 protein [Corynebacterium pseudodiphtheriticum]
MRVAIVAESFLPHVNGVSNSVLRILEYLNAQGHDAIVIAPGPHGRGPDNRVPDHPEISHYAGFRVVRVPTIRLPFVDSLPIGVPTPTVYRTLAEFRPDIVHLASPFALGRGGGWAARRLGIPRVAVFQTDIAGFAGLYQLGVLQRATWRWIRRMHNHCQLTLAPSTQTIQQLESHGVRNLAHWGRGVDTQLFHPEKRSDALRRKWCAGRPKQSPPTIVGYVGRLANEKGVHRLAALSGRTDVQLVIVGDGPCRSELETAMPDAVFCGALSGQDLAAAYASFDVFVHPGELETFCQTIQEAQASGVPTIAPRVGGPVDLIRDGSNGNFGDSNGNPDGCTGLLLDPDNFEAELADAVSWLAAPSRRQELSAAAREHVEDKTWPRICAQLVDYYRQVLAEVNPAAWESPGPNH